MGYLCDLDKTRKRESERNHGGVNILTVNQSNAMKEAMAYQVKEGLHYKVMRYE